MLSKDVKVVNGMVRVKDDLSMEYPTDEDITKIVTEAVNKYHDPIRAANEIQMMLVKKYKLSMAEINKFLPKINMVIKMYSKPGGAEEMDLINRRRKAGF